MKNIVRIIKGARPYRASEIRAAFGDLPDDGDGAIVTLQARRREGLLDSLAGAEIEAIDRALAAAVIERDRSRLFRAELTLKLGEAETVEALRALSDRRVRAEASSRDLSKRFARFSELLGELGDMLADDRAHHRECDEIDRLHADAGLSARVKRAGRPNFGVAEHVIPTLVGAK